MVGRPSWIARRRCGGPPEGPGVVGRPTRRAGSDREAGLPIASSGWEAVLEGREWLGGSTGGPGAVGRHFRSVKSGLEALSEGREWSEGPPEGPGVVLRPSLGPGVVARP